MTGSQSDPRFTVGMIAEWRGQKYRLIDIRPHVGRDGRDTQIMVWRSRCLYCNGLFETTTPLREFSGATRRCPAHVKRGRIADHWRVMAAADPPDYGIPPPAERPPPMLTPQPAYRATNRVPVRGQRLSRIIWQGRQWAVTKHGIECRDGTYPIDKRRLWEDADGFGWVQHMAEKDWVNLPDFTEALRIARQVHAKHSPRPSRAQPRTTGQQ